MWSFLLERDCQIFILSPHSSLCDLNFLFLSKKTHSLFQLARSKGVHIYIKSCMISPLYLQFFTYYHSHLLLNIPACWKLFINTLWKSQLPGDLHSWICGRLVHGPVRRGCKEHRVWGFFESRKRISVQFIWCLSFIGDHWRVGDHRWRSWLLRNGSGHHRGEISSYEYTKMVTLLVIPFFSRISSMQDQNWTLGSSLLWACLGENLLATKTYKEI